jgi:hypothetical protein
LEEKDWMEGNMQTDPKKISFKIGRKMRPIRIVSNGELWYRRI